jgi:hypothetical protein
MPDKGFRSSPEFCPFPLAEWYVLVPGHALFHEKVPAGF